MGKYKKRTLVHVEAGDERWTPTTEELDTLTSDFKRALEVDQDDIGLIVTRNAVKVHIREVEGDTVLDVQTKGRK
jgi:hypothetical protein